MLTLKLRLLPSATPPASPTPDPVSAGWATLWLVLHLDVVLHHVAVRMKPHGLGDAKAVPVLADELQFSLRPHPSPAVSLSGEMTNATGFGGPRLSQTVKPQRAELPATTIGFTPR